MFLHFIFSSACYYYYTTENGKNNNAFFSLTHLSGEIEFFKLKTCYFLESLPLINGGSENADVCIGPNIQRTNKNGAESLTKPLRKKADGRLF